MNAARSVVGRLACLAALIGTGCSGSSGPTYAVGECFTSVAAPSSDEPVIARVDAVGKAEYRVRYWNRTYESWSIPHYSHTGRSSRKTECPTVARPVGPALDADAGRLDEAGLSTSPSSLAGSLGVLDRPLAGGVPAEKQPGAQDDRSVVPNR